MLQNCGFAPRINLRAKVAVVNVSLSDGSAISIRIVWMDPMRMDAVSTFFLFTILFLKHLNPNRPELCGCTGGICFVFPLRSLPLRGCNWRRNAVIGTGEVIAFIANQIASGWWKNLVSSSVTSVSVRRRHFRADLQLRWLHRLRRRKMTKAAI